MSQARKLRRRAQKTGIPDADKAITALSNLTDLTKFTGAMTEVQQATAALVQDYHQLLRRVDRLSFALETVMGTVAFQSALAEFERLHPEPPPETGEDT